MAHLDWDDTQTEDTVVVRRMGGRGTGCRLWWPSSEERLAKVGFSAGLSAGPSVAGEEDVQCWSPFSTPERLLPALTCAGTLCKLGDFRAKALP